MKFRKGIPRRKCNFYLPLATFLPAPIRPQGNIWLYVRYYMGYKASQFANWNFNPHNFCFGIEFILALNFGHAIKVRRCWHVLTGILVDLIIGFEDFDVAINLKNSTWQRSCIAWWSANEKISESLFCSGPKIASESLSARCHEGNAHTREYSREHFPATFLFSSIDLLLFRSRGLKALERARWVNAKLNDPDPKCSQKRGRIKIWNSVN